MIWLDSCGSTNAELLGRDLPHGSGLAARVQTAGRGRLGRNWQGAEGNLAMSVLLRPQVDPMLLPLFTLGAGVVLAELTGLQLKWPNDLLDPRGRKVAGILAEAEWSNSTLAKLVVGIGVNLVSAPHPGAASLRQNGLHFERTALAEELRSRLEDLDVGTVRERWMRCSCTLGRRVEVGRVEGVAVGLAANGALLVESDGTIQTVTTGDLLFS